MKEPETIEEILFYWAERGIMLELLAEGGGAWRVYALNADGSEHGGDGDHGCHHDVTFIVRHAHWVLRHWDIEWETPDQWLFQPPIDTKRPEARWYERGVAGERYREMGEQFKLDTSDPETQRCLAEIRKSIEDEKVNPSKP